MRWRSPSRIFLVLTTATLAILAVKGGLSFLTVSQLAGRDLASNYAFTWLMQDNLLHGGIIRWSNHWMLGFPSFAFYPPLFFVFTAALNLLTGQVFGLLAWYKAVVLLSLLLVPGTAYLFFRDILGEEASLFASIYMLYYLFVYPPLSAVYQSLNGGLVAQGFAFFLLLPATGLLFREGRKASVASGLLLGATALAHPFVGTVGFLVAGFHVLSQRTRMSVVPPAIGLALFLPWMLNALRYLPFLATYTAGTVRIGTFTLLLLPLILIGGYRGEENRVLLAAFLTVLATSAVELPFITQEIRFYTYALGIGSILAGIGAYRAYTHMHSRYGRKQLFALAVVLPVFLIALQAPSGQHWSFDRDTGTIYSELSELPQSRIMVETDNSSLFDSYALQAMIPLNTQHRAVNDVHLDSSPSANYILTLEDWVSEDMVPNPICRTCTAGRPPPSLVDRRLDDLGVRYVAARTPESSVFLNGFMEKKGSAGGYTIFENTEGYRLVEPLESKPVALVGEWEEWRQVNDRLFASNVTAPVLWQIEEPSGTSAFSAVIRLDAYTPAGTVEELRDAELVDESAADLEYSVSTEGVELSSNVSAPVKIKTSYFPTHSSDHQLYAGSFNTITAVVEGSGTVRFGR